ncbi:MAG: DUF262 domain-containing protein [Candidatus Nealsonbacteria bacterium]|nr:MAG: DUF262 domain-containing protein [Candidatus Nealsonbacteria bacterium]
MAIIAPKPKSLKELIRDKYYRVPLYQRSYDWEIDKVSVLWDDVYKNAPGYFLGIVLFKPGSESDLHPVKFEIVDGQQRLATLLLLLRAAVETLEQAGSKDIAHEFQRDYINQKSAGEKESRMTLILNKRDKDKFEHLLLGEQFRIKKKLSSWKNLDKAIQFFREKFGNLIKEQGKDGIINFINRRILKLSFTEILLGTDSDVYQFFETLNDRGMDLSIADLVKNRVCAEASKQKADVEESALTIDKISEELGSGKLKGFLLHYCWANDEGKEPTPRKKLMVWYGNRVSKADKINNFLDHLETYALQYYINFVKPNKCTDSKKRTAFTYLDALGATRCYPLLLTGEESLKKKDFLSLCNAIEILTFRHSTILKRDAKVLEGVFFNMIRNLRKRKPIKEILEIFKRQNAMKADEQFKLAFAEFIPANHKIARYTLSKIEEVMIGKKQAPLSWDNLTLEHILAEKLDWEGREEYLERLGNLTLLSPGMNIDAANEPFKEKRKRVYKVEKRIKITKDLTSFPDFTKDTVISRQKDFAKLAIKIWNSKRIS